MTNELQMPEGAIGDINSKEKGSGARYNAGKPAMELIPIWIIAQQEYEFYMKRGSNSHEMNEACMILQALGEFQRGMLPASAMINRFVKSPWEDCANVFAYGKIKYAEWNWAKGMKWSIPVACIVRHCLAILRGEDVDPESGFPHRGHIACNIVMLMQYEITYQDGNDLPEIGLLGG